MKSRLALVLVMALVALFLLSGCGADDDEDVVSFALWTQEGEAEGAYQYVRSLAERYMEATPTVRITTVQKDTEELREDFQTASIAGSPPELMWTVNDHAGPFTAAGIIQPIGDLYDADEFIDGVVMDGETWGIPVSSGNHLMLVYNRALIGDTAPSNTDEMIEVAKQHTGDGRYGFAYNMTEPFWLVPWLGGFGGSVFEEDGVSPSLDTEAMHRTLAFLHSLTHEHRVTPLEADYGTMDTLFKEGSAAMIVNGDWSIGEYQQILGEDVGVAPIPMVRETGLWPAPYTSGKYFMVADGVQGELRSAIGDFINWVLEEERQLEMSETLVRLPARLSALENEQITGDRLLAGSAAAMANGTPMPAASEMRANWDAMLPEMNAVLAGSRSPADAAQRMQSTSLSAIAAMQ